MTLVKICGITNLEDALVSVDAGAHALGFNFYERSPRYIAPLAARAIIDQLPPDVLSVGVFVNLPDPESVSRIADEAEVGAIQLHGDETPQFCRALKGRHIIKAFRVDSDFSRDRISEYQTEGTLLDASSMGTYGGSGRIFDWSVASGLRDVIPHLFLAGGLSQNNVAEAIEIVRPYAVDACSCLESSPGRKDHRLVREFFTSVNAAC